MNLTYLNPVIRTVSLYERINRNEECIAYDSRLFYMVSGDVTAVVGGVKLGHLSPGHLLYVPAGTPYKLKGQYLRLVTITFDPTADKPEPEQRMVPVAASISTALLADTSAGAAWAAQGRPVMTRHSAANKIPIRFMVAPSCFMWYNLCNDGREYALLHYS